MTEYELIRNTFNATALCHLGERPRLDYEPGCLFVECSRGDACKCRLNDGDGIKTSAFLIEWRRRFAKS